MKEEIGKEFWELTKYQHLPESLQKRGFPKPAVEQPAPENSEKIQLPDGKGFSLEKTDLVALIEKRQTFRKYTDDQLSLDELAFLLWGTQGVKAITENPLTKRTVPSAGSRHPFETYLLINKVESLSPGLYRYLAIDNMLTRISAPEDIRERLTIACMKQSHVHESAVTFFWVADIMRTIWRYSQRGYRFILLDAGHVCQNLYIMAESINCGVCGIAAYDDDLVNQALGVNGSDLFTAYIATLGRRP
jgi:SagB-type dehydrogenase family enzyme